jgi:hypothetical protein
MYYHVEKTAPDGAPDKRKERKSNQIDIHGSNLIIKWRLEHNSLSTLA